MKLNFSIIKKRPLLVGGLIVVAGLIIFFLMNRGGGGSGGVTLVQGGADPAQNAMSLEMAKLQMAAGDRSQERQFQMALATMQVQAQTGLAQLAAQAEERKANRELDTQERLAGLAANIQLAGINAQVQQTQIGANVQQAMAQFGAQVQMAGIAAQKEVALAAAQPDILRAQGAFLMDQARAQNILPLAQLEASVIAHQNDLAANVANTAAFYDAQKVQYQAIAQSNIAQHAAQGYIAQANAMKQGTNWGGILTGVASVIGAFSDERLKFDIKLLDGDYSDRDFGTYTYRYKDEPENVYVGYIAQEVRKFVPSAVHEHPSGYLTIEMEKVAA